MYCSLFPENYGIDASKLVGYWIGEGYFGETETLKRAKDRGHGIIGGLESACLLERDGNEKVRMHG